MNSFFRSGGGEFGSQEFSLQKTFDGVGFERLRASAPAECSFHISIYVHGVQGLGLGFWVLSSGQDAGLFPLQAKVCL